MRIQVEINAEAEERLTAAAKARHVSAEDFAKSVLYQALEVPLQPSGKMTKDQLSAMLREIAEGSENLPQLPTSAFSRESFYAERS